MKELKQKIMSIVANDFIDIEKALEDNLTPYLSIVKETANHIIFSGGKRLRPLLMVLCARLCGYQGKYDKTFSTIFEYLHAATLLHDDLVDGAVLRRGKPVAHSVYGPSIAVLTGDFLLARSLSIAAQTKKSEIIAIIAKITEDMSQGEIDQLINKENLNLSEQEYMEVIKRKTAVLIQGACRSGAIIADADQKKEMALKEYGYNLGIAFQMADDILDYIADTKELGKEVGADLREGKLTMPLIYALKQAEQEDRIEMEKIIQNRSFCIQNFNKLNQLLHKYKGVEYTQDKAKSHIDKAKQNLLIFDPSETRGVLLMIADYALSRKI